MQELIEVLSAMSLLIDKFNPSNCLRTTSGLSETVVQLFTLIAERR